MRCVLTSAIASTFALAAAAPAVAQFYPAPYQPIAPYPQQAAPAAGAYAAPYGAPQNTYPGGYAAPPAGYAPAPQGYVAPAPQGYGPAPAGAYGVNTAYGAPAKCDKTGLVVGGLVGAVAGGVIGSNVAGSGNKTAGTVIGGLAGGGLGALVGNAHDKHKCDERGAYWSYTDTVPYQTASLPNDGDAAAYESQGCRLAAANVEGQGRYVRVCPDGRGRYRAAS